MIEGLSQREAARFWDRRTVRKMLSYSVPPGYVGRGLRSARSSIRGIIDRRKRIRIVRITHRSGYSSGCVGFTGKITIVKDYAVSQRRREMFVPLTHPPGHAQVDFGEALAVIGGVERKLVSLPHSDACSSATEAFCGHVGFSAV